MLGTSTTKGVETKLGICSSPTNEVISKGGSLKFFILHATRQKFILQEVVKSCRKSTSVAPCKQRPRYYLAFLLITAIEEEN